MSLILLAVAVDSLGPWTKVQAKYDAVNTLSASFVESVTYAEGYQEDFEGRLYVSRPDKIRLECVKPQEQLIVSDGSEAWLYLPASKEALRQSVAEVAKACDPRIFLFDTPADFKVSYQGRDSSHSYIFTPPAAGGYPYQKVTVTLGPDLGLTGVSVVDPLGNIYAFSLRDVKFNPTLEPGLFRFKPPEGTQIFGQ